MNTLRKSIYVINEDKMIYRVESFSEMDSNSYGLCYTLELVAGYDYVNPDVNDIQGFIEAKNFVEEAQAEWLTVYPMEESLGERLKEEGYKVIDIENITIHKYKEE